MRKISLIDCERTPSNRSDHYYSVSDTEPLGLLYLEAFLRERGVECEVFKSPLDHRDWRSIDRSEVVGISGLTYSWLAMKQVAREVRCRLPGSVIVCGREHASCAAEEVLAESAFDAVISGAGEVALWKIAQGAPWSDVPGAVWCDGAGAIKSTPRLEGAPPVATGQLQRRKPWMRNMLTESMTIHTEMAGLVLSRGCPYRCTFCTAPQMWGGYWGGDVEATIREIKVTQAKHGTRYFAFHDLMLNANAPRLNLLASRIIEEGIDAHFYGMMSAINRGLDLKLLREAGLIEVGVGLEVPDDRRRKIGKGSGFGEAQAFVQGLADAGIFVRGLFILGWPWDTNLQEIRERYRGALEHLPINALRLHFLTPFPGTEVWREHFDRFIYRDAGEAAYERLTTMEPVLDFGLSPQDLCELRHDILCDYYGSAHFARLAEGQRDWPRVEMTGAYVGNLRGSFSKAIAVPAHASLTELATRT